MREICTYGLEGGVAHPGHPYPYRSWVWNEVAMSSSPWKSLCNGDVDVASPFHRDQDRDRVPATFDADADCDPDTDVGGKGRRRGFSSFLTEAGRNGPTWEPARNRAGFR
jgi:hypothetical protein